MMKPLRNFEWLLTHALVIISMFGLVIYSIVRAGMDTFYGELGVKPEEVGLTYITTIARAAISIPVVLLWLIVPTWLFGSMLGLLTFKLLKESDSPALLLARRFFPPPPDPSQMDSISRLEAGEVVNPAIVVGGAAFFLTAMMIVGTTYNWHGLTFFGAMILSLIIIVGYSVQAMRAVKAQLPGKPDW